MTSSPRLGTTIVITTHAQDRWHSLVRTIASARSQSLPPDRIVVVVDHNTSGYHRIRRDLGVVHVLENAYGPGVAGTRNTGAFHATTALVAFLDDDTCADLHWLTRLVRPFTDAQVVGADGGSDPVPAPRRGRWLPSLWLPSTIRRERPETPSSEVSAKTMLVRQEAFRAVGGFIPDAAELDLRTRMTALGNSRWSEVTDATVRRSAARCG